MQAQEKGRRTFGRGGSWRSGGLLCRFLQPGQRVKGRRTQGCEWPKRWEWAKDYCQRSKSRPKNKAQICRSPRPLLTFLFVGDQCISDPPRKLCCRFVLSSPATLNLAPRWSHVEHWPLHNFDCHGNVGRNANLLRRLVDLPASSIHALVGLKRLRIVVRLMKTSRIVPVTAASSVVRYGVTANITAFHAVARGSIPRIGALVIFVSL